MFAVQKLIEILRKRTDALTRAVLRNSGWAVAGQAANAGETFIETFLLARFFTLEQLGIFFLLANASELVFGLLDFRTGEAVIKFLPELLNKDGKRGVSGLLRLVFMVDGSVAVVGVLIVLASVLAGSQLVSVSPEYYSLLMVIACGTALKFSVRSVGAYLRVTGAFQTSIKIGIVAAACRLTIMSVAAMSIGTISGISYGLAIADGIQFCLMLGICVYALRAYDAHPFTTPVSVLGKERIKLVLRFLASTNVAGTMRSLSTKLDVILIGYLSSPGVVALYKIASRVASSLMLFSDPLLIAVYPEMSKLHASNDDTSVRKIVRMLTRILGAVALVSVLAFLVFGKQVLTTLASPEYAAAYTATLIMFCGTGISMMFFWARPLLLIHGRVERLVLIALMALIFQFGLLYLLVPSMGIIGGAVSLAAGYVVQIGSFLFVLSRTPSFQTKS